MHLVYESGSDLSEDAHTFKKVYTQLGGECRTITQPSEWICALNEIPRDATLVDAILGTGTRGEISGLPRTVMEHWPDRYTVAVDIPSGMNADTGEICGCVIQANVTVTFQWSKVGFEYEHAHPYLGKVHVVDIGIPTVCADDTAWKMLGVEK